MTSFNPIRQLSGTIAIIFAASISVVVACDFVCAVDPGLLFTSHIFGAVPADGAVTARTHHDGHYHDYRVSDSPKETQGHSQAPASRHGDNCCKDITRQFYQSLFKTDGPPNLVLRIMPMSLFPAVTRYEFRMACEECQHPARIPLNRPPPPAGIYIRILISSFLV